MVLITFLALLMVIRLAVSVMEAVQGALEGDVVRKAVAIIYSNGSHHCANKETTVLILYFEWVLTDRGLEADEADVLLEAYSQKTFIEEVCLP